MHSLIQKIFARLRSRSATVATAESFTGGQLADAFVSVPGASEFFKGGVVCYETALKTKILGVPAEIIEEFSVFSEPVAREMAERVARLCGTDFGLGTTGVAGPNPEGNFPAGTVFIAVSTPTGTRSRALQFPSRSRTEVRALSTRAALELFLESLMIL